MSADQSEREEYVTVIAPSAGEAMAQFTAGGLDRQGFSITGKIARHRVAVIADTPAPFPGDGMFVATFRRVVAE